MSKQRSGVCGEVWNRWLKLNSTISDAIFVETIMEPQSATHFWIDAETYRLVDIKHDTCKLMLNASILLINHPWSIKCKYFQATSICGDILWNTSCILWKHDNIYRQFVALNGFIKASILDAFCHRPYCTVTLNKKLSYLENLKSFST